MASIKTLNRTDENKENNRVQETKNNAEIALRPVWQGSWTIIEPIVA